MAINIGYGPIRLTKREFNFYEKYVRHINTTINIKLSKNCLTS